MSMTSSSSSPSALTFSSAVWKYHVFLSFRGEDTRKTFVDHLYTALVRKGICTYKDDETLPRGESIGPSLMAAIEESQIAVIIFSKNYPDSSWCLDELVHIMNCKGTRGLIVMPIFYDVDPSTVRKQKCKYGEPFLKYELENNSKVESWRKALVDASNISGWEPQHIANGHESICIKEIVDTISQRLHPLNSSVDNNLVGIKARMQDLIGKLQIGFGGKRMIGIWGVGGGGKTTLASLIYDEISGEFDGCCFIENVREELSNKKGLKYIQGKILSGILKQKKVKVGRVEEGRRMIKDRLNHKKVLIVLDDVDNFKHLEELAGSCDWFGEGSRIIITTRDEHVLNAHKVDVVHVINLLDKDEAMKLFCKHAPQGYRPTREYKLLSEEVVSYAGGLPLALRVIGSFLCDKEMKEWRSALDRLKEIPDAHILEVLKISFNGLTTWERELFLDIACFFRKGSLCCTNADIMSILGACGFHPVIGIKVLVQKALISISEDGRFDMHDLVQEMAHYIVRGEHPKNPEKHSRVWEKEDVMKICAMDATMSLDKIEAISIKCKSSDELQPFRQILTNMRKLRWINFEVYNGRLLDETPLPLFILPENFRTRELCCLTLSFLGGKQLWEGYKYLPNLRMINLYCLWNLIETPDFDGLPNLERFQVDRSPLLEEIHPSFGHLKKLVYVEISECNNLKMLPPITRSKKLEALLLPGCKLVSIIPNIQQNMENFVPHNMNHIRLLFSGGCLRKLDLSWCKLEDRNFTSAAGWVLPNLQELNLTGNRFVRLNFSLLRLPGLKWLDLSFCERLVELLELPSSISVAIADECRSLESFGDISNCKWLWKVSAAGDNKLGPLSGDIILDSMLQGNAKDHFISFIVSGFDVWRGRIVWLNWVKTYNMLLPDDWYNDFSGILMFVSTNKKDYHVNPVITIHLGVLEYLRFEISHESNETLETHDHHTCVGYVSFTSLGNSGCLNSTYNFISFSLSNENLYGYGNGCTFGAVLVPKDEVMRTTKFATNYSEFWDEKEVNHRKTFITKADSNSSVEIIWNPSGH